MRQAPRKSASIDTRDRCNYNVVTKGSIMKAELIRIGNSQGIRIPKAVIEQCGFGQSVDIQVRKNCLVISPTKAIREGWDRAFEMKDKTKDNTLSGFESIQDEWDETEWVW